MPEPTQLEVALALRKTSSWVRKPTTPTCFRSLAKDRDGRFCQPLDPGAVSFCALGYLLKSAGVNSYSRLQRSAPALPPPADEFFPITCSGERAVWIRWDVIEENLQQNDFARALDAREHCAQKLDEWAELVEASLGVAEEPKRAARA